MRTTIVPAQITTVEDKIAGNLGVLQMLLLSLPIFGGSAAFVVLPPFFNYATYKVVLIVCLAALCGTLAIRVKGRVLLLWMIILLRYMLRPKYYVSNKNDPYLRDIAPQAKPEQPAEEAKLKPSVRPYQPQLSTPELVRIEDIMANPQANLHFTTTRKGALSVHITEVK